MAIGSSTRICSTQKSRNMYFFLLCTLTSQLSTERHFSPCKNAEKNYERWDAHLFLKWRWPVLTRTTLHFGWLSRAVVEHNMVVLASWSPRNLSNDLCSCTFSSKSSTALCPGWWNSSLRLKGMRWNPCWIERWLSCTKSGGPLDQVWPMRPKCYNDVINDSVCSKPIGSLLGVFEGAQWFDFSDALLLVILFVKVFFLMFDVNKPPPTYTWDQFFFCLLGEWQDQFYNYFFPLFSF